MDITIKIPKRHRAAYLKAKKKREELKSRGVEISVYDLLMQQHEEEKDFYKGFRL